MRPAQPLADDRRGRCPRAPWLHAVKAGQPLRIVDLEGNQAVDFLVCSAADDAERYSAQDTIAAQKNIFLREGSVLLSNEGAPTMTVTATAVAYHDTIGGACSCESNTLRYGHHTKASTPASRTSWSPTPARVGNMLSKLMTGVWRFLCDGFTARGGRYWLT